MLSRSLTLIAILFSAFTAPAAAQAGDDSWAPVATQEGGGTVTIQLTSVKPTGPNQLKAWFKTDYTDYPSRPVKISMTLEEYDCSERTYRLELGIFYMRTGVTKRERQVEWAPAPPETIAELKLNAICTMRKR